MTMDVGILDQVTQEFLTAFRSDSHAITAAAKSLFFKLALIQLTVSALWMALTGESLQRLLIRFVQLSASFGVFYACIKTGGQWIPDIINGFIELGQTGGVSSVDPSSVVDQGLSLAGALLQAFFNWGLLAHPFVSLVGAIVCIAIVILYGLLAAELAIVLIKSYVLISFSSLFFAFGGSELTRSMSVQYFKTVLGIGLQLMTLYFLMGVGQHVGEQWVGMTQVASEHHELMPMLVILTGVILYYMIVKNVPTFIANLAGVGGLQHSGATSALVALQASRMGSVHLGASARFSGGVMQGSGQVVQAASSAWKAGPSGVGHLASAAFRSAQDAVMQRNTHQTFGQRLNKHLANRVKKHENG